MSTVLLGPSVHVTESGAVPTPTPTPGRVGIQFDPTEATRPGGVARVQLLPPAAPTDEPPIAVHVYYVPTALIPSPITVAAVQSLAGVSTASHTLPTPAPAPAATWEITVSPTPGIGTYLVQTILEYAS